MELPDFIPEGQLLPDEEQKQLQSPAPALSADSDVQNVDTSITPSTASALPDFIPEGQLLPDEEKYTTPSQKLLAGLEGAAKGIVGPLAPLTEKAFGVKEEDIRGRAEQNPYTGGAGQLAGLVGSTIAGVGVGGALAKIGASTRAGLEALGIGKIGSGVAAAALENVAFQAQEEVSKLVLNDPNQSVDTAVADMGLAAVLGGAVGTLPPLWNATLGKKLGGILGATADKLGGIEGVAPEAFDKAISRAGVDIAPELRALVAKDPAIQQSARSLLQTDINASGLQYQQKFNEFRDKLGNSAIEALGKTPEEVAALGDIDKYAIGKSVGDKLAEEYEKQITPIAKVFEDLKVKFKDIELPKAVKGAAGDEIPSAVDQISDKIMSRAINEGWTASPSSDIMREVNRVVKELPLQKNLKNLGDYITQVSQNTSADALNGPLRRAGGIITSIMKEAEADLIANKLGQIEGPQAVELFTNARRAYAEQASLKEAIDSRLHAKGSVAGFAKQVREMAQTDGETLLRRLAGKDDADLLNTLITHYPETAELVRNYHINDLLKSAASKAPHGMTIDTASLLRNMDKLSPQLKQFIAPAESLEKIKAISDIVAELKNPKHNFSNTSRVAEALLKDIPGTAVGAIGAMSGHGFIKSSLMGALMSTIGKDVPDAIKLSMMKWLGTPKEIKPSAFKAMVQFIENTRRGENFTSKVIKDLIKGSSQVLPDKYLDNHRERQKLSKAIDKLHNEPEGMLNLSGDLGHYLPGQAAAIGTTAASAVQLLRSMKPNTAPQNPLDGKRIANPVEEARYNRALDIAQQPLIILQHIANGTLTPEDVNIQKTIYPGLYNRISQKMMDQVAEATAKGEQIPYKTRLGMSLYLGQALDSTIAPAGILAAQPVPTQMPPMPNIPKQKANSDLNKMPGMYKTPLQNSQENKILRSSNRK